MTPAVVELRVQDRWDGAPLPGEPPVVLQLSAASGDRLRIRVDAPFHDDPPPPGVPGPTIALWEHEVVELFVLGAGGPADEPPVYTEVELGPHGHHLVLVLRGVRQVVGRLLPLSYETQVDREGGRWQGEALLDRGLLPPPPHRVNAYAIHGEGSRRQYRALYPVPGQGPDFHRLDCFEEVRLP